MSGKHGPNRLGNYINVHEAWMKDLAESGFVIEDLCEFSFVPGLVLLTGQVHCLDHIVLAVEKQIAVLSGNGPSAVVQTKTFRYHAWVRQEYNIFRYCSAHGHRPYPHKHIFDPFDEGRESHIIELRTEDEIPTMGEAIVELRDWHSENFGRLLESF